MDLQVTTRGFRARKNMVEMKIGPPLPKRFKERSLLATGNEARRRQMSTTISQGWPDVVEGEKNKRTIEVGSRETSQHNKERKKDTQVDCLVYRGRKETVTVRQRREIIETLAITKTKKDLWAVCFLSFESFIVFVCLAPKFILWRRRAGLTGVGNAIDKSHLSLSLSRCCSYNNWWRCWWGRILNSCAPLYPADSSSARLVDTHAHNTHILRIVRIHIGSA